MTGGQRSPRHWLRQLSGMAFTVKITETVAAVAAGAAGPGRPRGPAVPVIQTYCEPEGFSAVALESSN